MEPSNLNRHFKTTLKRAGLPATTRFHDLRHSCATFLIAQGVYPRVVMEILGHSQISLTINMYGHVLPETQREATTKVADLFGTLEPKPGAPPNEEQEESSATAEKATEAAPEERVGEEAELPVKPTDGHEQPPSAVERLDGNADERLYNAEDDNAPV